MKRKNIFISGTNTEVGKTFVTLNIIKLLVFKGTKVNPYKPIETGCKEQLSELIPHDSMLFYKAINKRISLNQINPYRFLEPISPAAAIKRSRKKIYIKDYRKKLEDLPSGDITLIEGAGGLCSPLAPDGYNIDLIKRINAPTILVAKDEIGVINNVMLSINMLNKYKIKILAIVLNRKANSQPVGMNNYKEIKSLTKTPLIQILNKKHNNQKEFNKLIKLITA
ncbi:MAG: dethiobiotin synthase [Gammaproteobacteria bacterium]|nr:dethiobiotin synthase [Gammaproteobacteria bacterium]MBT4462234.1 dethiobiotin synthase [Gammaproteobacteria bacterium]MBT4654480.1 dethiobiotin synthase [Gammaproteobacteria bacterium]MBT5117367.1 dethiobiotin synthase [Gammaproteobacteria bacterium]MBT5761978.1 dethiobiotin synthase [Gammaproteobacteria bacterium]